MPCSAVTLSLATIAAVVSVALLAIAFSTDNWVRYDVNREKLKESLKQETKSKVIFFTRTEGFFRQCFPDDRPQVYLYLSPVETHCRNINYYTADDDRGADKLSKDEVTRLHLGRAMIALFIISFFFFFIAFWTGLAGCWKRSPGNITATAILMLFACLLSAGGMGLFHGVEYYEKGKLSGKDYYQSWPEELRTVTSENYDWSYITSWISVGTSMLSAVFFFISASSLSGEKRNEKQAVQNSYVMPVYPQKQQQYSYGYAYPGPYQYGSQYGPYNY